MTARRTGFGMPFQHLEGLRLERVDVRRRDEAVRLHGDLDERVLPVRVGGRPHEVDRLAGDRVVQDVSAANRCRLLALVDDTQPVAERDPGIGPGADSMPLAAVISPSSARTTAAAGAPPRGGGAIGREEDAAGGEASAGKRAGRGSMRAPDLRGCSSRIDSLARTRDCR
jgi:hypothetical protein